MKFPTKYNHSETPYTNCGDPIKIEYAIRVVDGETTLCEVGKSNLYEYIQSHADSVDLHKILERCAMLDDYSALNRMPAAFMDVTNMPKTLAEAFAMTQDAKNFFDMMPTYIKNQYGDNFVEFIKDIGSDNFTKNVTSFLDSIAVKEEEKVENES